MKDAAVQRVKRIVSGEVVIATPVEELIVSSLKKIRHLLLTSVSIRRGVSTKLSRHNSNDKSVQSSLR